LSPAPSAPSCSVAAAVSFSRPSATAVAFRAPMRTTITTIITIITTITIITSTSQLV
jgi:hypothetical protein